MEQLIDFHAPEVQAVLDTLLKDRPTGKNIIWATDPPEELQTVMYEPVTDKSQITTQQLGLTHYEVVLPRMMKQTDTQQQRTRKKGEVFSPAWVCNKMNNALVLYRTSDRCRPDPVHSDILHDTLLPLFPALLSKVLPHDAGHQSRRSL